MADGSITIKAILDDADFKRRLQEIKKSLKSMDGDSLSGLTSQANSAEDSLDKLSDTAEDAARSVEELREQSKGAADGLEQVGKGSETSSGKVGGLSSKTQNTAKKMQSMGSTLTRTVTPAILGMGAAAGFAAVQIDTALTGVKKTVDGTEEQYQQLKQAAIEFSKTNAVSASQILDIQALGAQLGYSIDELDMFGQVVSGLDIATNMSADEAATELAQFANIMGMSHDQTQNYGSTIVELGNNFATTEADISHMAMRIAGAGKSIGLSESEVLGLATALSSMGIEAEAGGTAISTVMSTIDKSVATNSDHVQDWAKAAGMSAQDFSRSWKENAVDTLSKVLIGMDGAVQSGGNLSQMLDELGISSIRQTDMLKRLANNSEFLGKAVGVANAAWVENSALQAEVDNRNQSLAARFEILKNRVIAMAEQFGGPLCDALLSAIDAAEPLFEAISDGAQAFADLDEDSQRLILAVVGLSAAMGPMLSVGGKVLELSMKFPGKINGVTAATGGLAAALIAILAVDLITQFNTYNSLLEDAEQATSGFAEAVEYSKSVNAAASENLSDSTAAMEAFGEASGGSKKSLREITDATHECTKKQAQLAQSIHDSYEELYNNMGVMDRSIDVIQRLGNKYDENGIKCSLSAKEQTELAIAVKNYNDITGESIGIVNSQTGELDVSTESLKENAEAWEENARAQVAQEALVDIYKRQEENKRQLIDVTKELEEADRGWGVWIGDFPLIADEASVAYHDLENQKRTIDEQNEELAKSEAYYAEQVEIATAATEGMTDLASGAAEALGVQSEATNEVAAACESYNASIGKIQEELADVLEDSPMLASAMLYSGDTVETLSKKLFDAGLSAKDIESKIKDLSDTTCNEFDTIALKSDYSIDKMIENLQENQRITGEWKDNLVTLYGNCGSEAEVAFVSHLEELGPEYALLVADLTNDPEAFAAMSENWNSGVSDAITVPSDLLDSKTEALNRLGCSFIDQLGIGVQQAEDGLQVEVDSVVAKAFESVSGQDFEEYGGYITQGLADGIDAEAFKAELAAQGLSEDVIEALMEALDAHSPSREAKRVGGYVPDGLAEGIKGNSSPISAASTLGLAIISTLSGILSPVRGQGSGAVESFAGGMTSAIGQATTSALSVASASLRGLGSGDSKKPGSSTAKKFSDAVKNGSIAARVSGLFTSGKAIEGLSKGNGAKPGSKLGRNFSSGLKSASGAAGAAGWAIADAAATQMSSLSENSYSWGSHAGNNFASGLSSSMSVVSKAALDLAETAAAKIKHTVPKEGPLRNGGKGEAEWGKHAVLNFAQGFDDALPQFERTLVNVPAAAAKVFKTVPVDVKLYGVANEQDSWVVPDGGAANSGGWAGSIKNTSTNVITAGQNTDAITSKLDYLIKSLPHIISSSCPDALSIGDKEFARLVRDSKGWL